MEYLPSQPFLVYGFVVLRTFTLVCTHYQALSNGKTEILHSLQDDSL